MSNLLMIRIIFFVLTSTCSASPNYGPFQVEISRMDQCAGPRKKNCTTIDTSGMTIDGRILSVHLKVLENIIPTKGKIVAMSNGKELVRLQMNKPCEHLFLRPLLETMFTVSKSCTILKSDYKLNMDLDEMMNAYFGGKFFYGNASFRCVVFGSECNFSCTNLFLKIRPKK